MSGHLRGNWRGTKKSFMISYWPCEQKEGVRVIPALCQRDLQRSQPTEQMQSAGMLCGVWVLVQRDLKIQVQLPQSRL